MPDRVTVDCYFAYIEFKSNKIAFLLYMYIYMFGFLKIHLNSVFTML